MRLISTLCLLFIALYCSGQVEDASKVIVTGNCWGRKAPETNSIAKALAGRMGCGIVQAQKMNVEKKQVVYSCRLRMDNPPQEPLLVIDGIVKSYETIGKLNPNDIESIYILKDATATVIYGCHPSQGVIIITTKGARLRKFIIKDFLDGSSVPGATVSFVDTDNKNALMFVANDSGVIVTDKLKTSVSYEMKVSAVGYNTLTKKLKASYGNNEYEVKLGRDIKTCENVLIRSYPMQHHGCPRNCFLCRTNGITIIADSIKERQESYSLLAHRVYPNPVQRGSLLSLVLDGGKEAAKSVRIVSMDGREMMRQSLPTSQGNNIFQLSMDTRWAAGIYFVQLIYENERIQASDKIIIQ